MTITEDKEKGEIFIEEAGIVKPHEMDALGFAISGLAFSHAKELLFTRTSTRMTDGVEGTDAKVKKIVLLICESGKKKGAKTEVDPEMSVWDYVDEGKRIAKFVGECLDGGGCVKVCRASVTMR